MSPGFRSILASWLLLLSLNSGVLGGDRGDDFPVLTGIFPPGASTGQLTEWVFSGLNLSGVKSLVVSGSGVDVLDLSIRGSNIVTAKIRVAEGAEPGLREVRLDGPSGISNLVLVRIDRLNQVIEVEPNDSIRDAQPIPIGTALVGVLKRADLDYYRIEGTPGTKLTIDLEARRLGTSIAPLLTVFSGSGAAKVQGRAARGIAEDCRISVVLPADGVCVVQVRDNHYRGNDQAAYRLRVDPSPFATTVFPIGGERRTLLDLEVLGGNLDHPLRKPLRLSQMAGSLVDPGFLEGPHGPIWLPGRIVVGDGPEIVEPEVRPEGLASGLDRETTVNGRISKPGEVDSYQIRVKAGEKLRIEIEAALAGSWLDSVIVLRDPQGITLAENDDKNEALRPLILGIVPDSTDSSLDFEAKQDGPLTIDVFDRFGDGGLEYPYRLRVGRVRPDFRVTLRPGHPSANASTTNTEIQGPASIGSFEVVNLKPGTSFPIHFVVDVDGRPGPIEVSVEGLPEGVRAEPIRIRFPGPNSSIGGQVDPVADFIVVKGDGSARPGRGEFKVVGRARPTADHSILREATATIDVDTSKVSGRPILRSIQQFPIRVLGEVSPKVREDPE